MDLQHWCYGNANYPATYAPIESDPAFKPGLRWFAWYMKDWKALIYSKFSCMLHFGSLVDWTEVLDKKYWSAFSVISLMVATEPVRHRRAGSYQGGQNLRGCAQRERKEQTPSATFPFKASAAQRLRRGTLGGRRRQRSRAPPLSGLHCVKKTRPESAAGQAGFQLDQGQAVPKEEGQIGSRQALTKTKTQSQMTLSPDRLDDLSVP